jgi:SHS2 domain-containing protein
MPYKIIDHTADIAVEVTGNSITNLFISAGEAWRDTVLDFENILMESSKKFIFNSVSMEGLLVEFLSELNFQLYTKKWCFVSCKNLLFQRTKTSIQLEAEVFGQYLNSDKHKIKEEIKAITYHQMKIEDIDGIFNTKIIFDV